MQLFLDGNELTYLPALSLPELILSALFSVHRRVVSRMVTVSHGWVKGFDVMREKFGMLGRSVLASSATRFRRIVLLLHRSKVVALN